VNKVLLLLVITVFIVVGALIVNIGGDDARTTNTQLESASTPPQEPSNTELSAAEKDTYVNTIKTISAKYRHLEERIASLSGKQTASEKTIPTDTEINQTVGNSVAESADSLRRDFSKQFTKLRGEIENKFKKSSVSPNSDNGIPAGLGFDGLNNPAGRIGIAGAPKTMSGGWSTVMPIGSEAAGKDGKIGGGVLNWYTDKLKTNAPAQGLSQSAAASSKKTVRKTSPNNQLIPAYTIPRNATLFSNSTMTALLGVIPVEGSILDPIRFKLITGQTNMATNGLFIPGVRNIVWSGIAIGNREMACVRGELHSVTFTFDDGTIRTVSTSKSTSATKNTGGKRILGYISDRQGSPCLKGQLITNAGDYLNDRMIASGIAATADAYSATQKTTVVDNGIVQSFFSGDQGDFIAGKALSGSLAELSEYMRERARNAVDLVYLQAGQNVVLHVEESIDIDYEPNGRKLEYANPISLSTNRYRLD